MRALLRRGRLSGQCEYQGQIVAAGQWEAIITPAQTAAIRRVLDDPARKTERAPSRYLLTKLLTCGLCRKPLISHPRRDKPGYCCRKDAVGGCGRISISAEPLDEYVRDLVLDALDGPDLAAALAHRAEPRQDADTLADLIRTDEVRQLVLVEALADGDMTRDQFAAANRRITERLTANRDRLATLSGQRDLARYLGQGHNLRDRWDTMTLDQRRAVIRTTVRTVTISPATQRVTFDPNRAELTWRV